MLSGLSNNYSKSHMKRLQREVRERNQTVNKILIKCSKLQDLIDKHSLNNFGFISIDTEGSELEVLESLDLTKTHVTLFIIENSLGDRKVEKYLKLYGFHKALTIEYEEFYVKYDDVNTIQEIANTLFKKNLLYVSSYENFIRVSPLEIKILTNYISYSLFGTGEEYLNGTIMNIKNNATLMPGWVSVVYVSESMYSQYGQILRKLPCKIVTVKSEENQISTIWRFFATDLVDSELILFRDCDSIITEREIVLINQWVNSNKALHIIRDHPSHVSSIMAGLCGVRKKKNPKFTGSFPKH